MDLIGTKWKLVNKSSTLGTDDIEFLENDLLIHPAGKLNTWKKDGNKITMEIYNKYLIHEGILKDDKIIGNSVTKENKKWTFEATLIKSSLTERDKLKYSNHLNHIFSNKDIKILINEYVPNYN